MKFSSSLSGGPGAAGESTTSDQRSSGVSAGFGPPPKLPEMDLTGIICRQACSTQSSTAKSTLAEAVACSWDGAAGRAGSAARTLGANLRPSSARAAGWAKTTP
jgi:hypothetical protein